MKPSDAAPVDATSDRTALSLLEMVIVLMLVALLAALMIPLLRKPREATRASICSHNLRQIETAKEVWALEQGKSADDEPIPEALAPYLKKRIARIVCPSGGRDATFEGSYHVGTVSEFPSCAIRPDTHTY